MAKLLHQKHAVAGAVHDEASVTVVYTDGGCDLNKAGIGAWAFTAHFPDFTVIQRGSALLNTTNNRMEMRAVIKALEILEIGRPIRIVSDSMYVISGCTEWHFGWIKRGWKTADGQDVKNRDMWEPLLALCELHAVEFKHVKGHAGNFQNDHVDKACTKLMIDGHKLALAGQYVPLDMPVVAYA